VLVKTALAASLATIALALPGTALSDNNAGIFMPVNVDTSACPGLTSSGAATVASGMLTVRQLDPGSGVFNLSSTFRGSSVDPVTGASYFVSYSGSIRGAPSSDVLGVGTLVFMGPNGGIVAHNVPLIAFGPISFDLADAGWVKCVANTN
jgi:hypothetical protein